MPEVLLRAEHVNKNFGAVVALDRVTLHLPKGEITGLVGDNGAGKSTLIKIISGALTPDAGSIEFDGRPAHFTSPAEARARGIETVYQDLALVGNIAVWANVYLGRELTAGPTFLHMLDRRAMLASTGEMLKRFMRNPPPIDEPVEKLSGGQRQVVAIARAGAWGSKLILMDKPTVPVLMRYSRLAPEDAGYSWGTVTVTTALQVATSHLLHVGMLGSWIAFYCESSESSFAPHPTTTARVRPSSRRLTKNSASPRVWN
jgi:ABC-type branched-subunit amino acid transport system ATPase component